MVHLAAGVGSARIAAYAFGNGSPGAARWLL
jgi:hypothetical protein